MKKLLLLLILAAAPLWSRSGRLCDVLQQDLSAGKITRAQFLRWQLQAAVEPEKLPGTYRECEGIFSQSLTVLAAEARMLLPELTGEERLALQALLLRPSVDQLPQSLITDNGLFKIHYTSTGIDSCSQEYAQEVARTFDYLYGLQVETLGFQPPPDDQGIDGPELDIYILRFYPYGETIYENPVANSGGMTYTSFMKIDRNFLDPRYFTKGVDAMHVTSAHELFHMIHGGYRFFLSTELNSVFLFEASSTWMEDYAYDEVNDYLQYINAFMRNPNHAFHSALHHYGLALYMHMICKQYGVGVIRNIWEAFRDQEAYDAIQTGLHNYHASFENSLADFTIWNCFTANRADTAEFYQEGDLYPALTPKQSADLSGEANISGSCDLLVSHYNLLTVRDGGNFVVTPTFLQPADWVYGVVVNRPDGSSESQQFSGDQPVALVDVPESAQIWLCPTNILRPSASSYSGPLDYAFRVVVNGSLSRKKQGIVHISPAPFFASEAESIEIQFRFNEPQAQVRLYILSENGRIILEQDLGIVPEGLNRYFWKVCSQNGQPVASGIYLCLITGDTRLPVEKMAVIR